MLLMFLNHIFDCCHISLYYTWFFLFLFFYFFLTFCLNSLSVHCVRTTLCLFYTTNINQPARRLWPRLLVSTNVMTQCSLFSFKTIAVSILIFYLRWFNRHGSFIKGKQVCNFNYFCVKGSTERVWCFCQYNQYAGDITRCYRHLSAPAVSLRLIFVWLYLDHVTPHVNVFKWRWRERAWSRQTSLQFGNIGHTGES